MTSTFINCLRGLLHLYVRTKRDVYMREWPVVYIFIQQSAVSISFPDNSSPDRHTKITAHLVGIREKPNIQHGHTTNYRLRYSAKFRKYFIKNKKIFRQTTFFVFIWRSTSIVGLRIMFCVHSSWVHVWHISDSSDSQRFR